MNSGAFSGSCGLCAKVTYGGNCVVAPIVDMCPGCGSGLDLSLHAFGALVGGESKAKQMGVANVNYEIVVCPRNRASTGSSSTTDTDPCSGSASGSSSSSKSAGTTTSTTTSTSTSSSESRQTTTTAKTKSGSSSTSNVSTGGSATAGTSCGEDGTLYGFPCCTYAANVHDDWVDKNGYVYGWEDETTCIVPK